MNTSGQGDLDADKKRALALTPVSRETKTRLEKFVDLLLHWQNKFNLVASSTLPIVWTRHVADSLQLLPLAPDAKVWVDFGSGAGFPGIPIACALADTPGVMVHLVPDEGVDSGPVLATATIAIQPDDDLAALEARVHAVEHELLVETLRQLTRQPTASSAIQQ